MSIEGMTGFSRREGVLGAWTWAVEARSVNGRNLETRFRGPPGFDGLERMAREAAQGRFHRGQVGINLQARRSETGGAVKINHELVDRYLAAIDPLVKSGKVRPPSGDGLLALRGVVDPGEDEEDADARAALEAAIAADIGHALDGLKAVRRSEGEALSGIIAGFLGRIEAVVASARAAAEEQPGLIRERFARRIAELAGEAVSEDRIVQEAALLAARADVREELDRLATHAEAARTILAEDGPAGRRLDFLAQEFMREASTLTAKAAAPALTTAGLDLKAVIDQLREQVQNVE
ncbi:MAG TPA: YicC/YloC family endoribonuclease [Caulobacteraceae bacterium]|nr:YicC/YloC family endoribonuclease [Caulobacteraceae bacterium]